LDAVPSWNPAALLQPNRQSFGGPDASQQQPPPRNIVNGRSRSAAPAESVVFQFSTPNTTSSEGPHSEASSPSSSAGAARTGVGNWIERMSNVQHRSSVPQPKRRKVDGSEPEQNGASVPVRSGGGGILGGYVKDKQKEANGAMASPAMTVDLTDGTFLPVRSPQATG
jgi:hypothetical protein